MTSLATGTRPGPYEILEPIGAGGMGEVYRALDTRLGREVAIKVPADRFTSGMKRDRPKKCRQPVVPINSLSRRV